MSLDHDLLADLTDPQREAAMHLDGPLLVLAGPGSGKTRVITRRVAYLISQGIPAWQILAVTFTNKAAGEMRERIDTLVPGDTPGRRGLTVATFHSLCARLLRQYAQHANLVSSFSIYDASDQKSAIKEALKQADMNSSNWKPSSVRAEISNAKNKLQDATTYAAEATDFYTRSIAKIYKTYEKILADNSGLDFDDLLLKVAMLLRENAEVREQLQQRYHYLLIDEYQDTNHAQFMIAHTLAKAHGNICVVGDPDQSIYGWRGADLRNILDFESHYNNAKVVDLGENFRSTGHIVAAADALIQRNTHRKHKALFSSSEEGEKPRVIGCRDEHHEATLVLDEFRRRREQGIAWKEMAVLYRVNALSRVMEETLRKANVPYVIARGTSFYDRREIKDALSYLRVIANPGDDVTLRRIINMPKRGIGKTTLEKVELHAINRQLTLLEAMGRAQEVSGLSNRAINAVSGFVQMVKAWHTMIGADTPDDTGLLERQQQHDLPDLVERVIRESGLEEMYRQSKSDEDQERVENLEEIVTAATEFTPANHDDETSEQPDQLTLADILTAYLDSVALVTDADTIDPANGAVTLLTLHAAKGLEFDTVAMIGLEQGLLPHSRTLDDESKIEEERRLCFVGITRAERHLMLTSASIRTHRGIRERTIPSMFLHELPDDAITKIDQSDEFADEVDEFDEDPSPELIVGSLVRHPQFGRGRVEALASRGSNARATIEFESVGVKTLYLGYARLSRVS